MVLDRKAYLKILTSFKNPPPTIKTVNQLIVYLRASSCQRYYKQIAIRESGGVIHQLKYLIDEREGCNISERWSGGVWPSGVTLRPKLLTKAHKSQKYTL